jgi:acyl-CoA reductase-like NAD-dependent aldehyde dehydrogenase
VLIGSLRTRPATQGNRPRRTLTDGSLASGAFYRPSLIEVEDVDAPIIQQEIFGPVATFEVLFHLLNQVVTRPLDSDPHRSVVACSAADCSWQGRAPSRWCTRALS